MKRVLPLFAAVPFLMAATLLIDAQNVPTFDIQRPTVLAFFPITERELSKDPDANEALADFRFYGAQAKRSLADAGIDYKETNAHSFRVRVRGTVATFRPTKEGVGYYFVGPEKEARVEYGVMADSALAEAAYRYFGLVPFDWDYRKAEQVDYHHTISSATSISAADRAALVRTVTAQLSTLEIPPSQEANAVAANIPVKLIDLNGDGVPEVIAQSAGPSSGCSPTGNCPFWVFRREENSYSVILESSAQLFRVQPSRTNGFHDIVLSLHGSAFESVITEYKFDGNTYKPDGCYDFVWGDAEHTYQQPHISQCSP